MNELNTDFLLAKKNKYTCFASAYENKRKKFKGKKARKTSVTSCGASWVSGVVTNCLMVLCLRQKFLDLLLYILLCALPITN